MGNVHQIARSNWFWINHLKDFQEGLKGFDGEYGKWEFCYADVKRRSGNAEINISSERWDQHLYNQQEESLDVLTYIQQHIKEGETCTLHVVSYEHALDMSINKYMITSERVEEIELLD